MTESLCFMLTQQVFVGKFFWLPSPPAQHKTTATLHFKCSVSQHKCFVNVLTACMVLSLSSCQEIILRLMPYASTSWMTLCAAVRQKCIYMYFINIVKPWTWLMLQVSHKHLDASQRLPKCWYLPCRKLSEREVSEFSNWGRLLSEEECKYTLLDRVKTEKHIFSLPLNREY